jgi:S-adenosylmethionine synthetase
VVLGPDAKSQVTIEEMENGSNRVHTILVSTMHSKNLSLEQVRNEVSRMILGNQCGLSSDIMNMFDDDTKIVVNPAGTWNVGSAVSDCGLTGRKIIADQYGPACTVGGGAFSGKCPSKTDRIGAYVARYIAKKYCSSWFIKKM